MMAAFSKLGYESFGIEPSAAGREAPPALASRIEQCYFGDESLAGPVDLITAFHVLEHVSDPEAFLKRCHGRLNEQGVLVIEVPSFEFARKRLNDDPVGLLNHISPYYHLHHFTRAGLDTMLRRTGFIPTWSGFVSPLFIRKLGTKASQSSRGNSEPSPRLENQQKKRPSLITNAGQAVKKSAWRFRAVRMRVRHFLANNLALGQYIRVIARAVDSHEQ
jgi:hypothetical protein